MILITRSRVRIPPSRLDLLDNRDVAQGIEREFRKSSSWCEWLNLDTHAECRWNYMTHAMRVRIPPLQSVMERGVAQLAEHIGCFATPCRHVCLIFYRNRQEMVRWTGSTKGQP